jgi:hypothetical protein
MEPKFSEGWRVAAECEGLQCEACCNGLKDAFRADHCLHGRHLQHDNNMHCIACYLVNAVRNIQAVTTWPMSTVEIGGSLFEQNNLS